MATNAQGGDDKAHPDAAVAASEAMTDARTGEASKPDPADTGHGETAGAPAATAAAEIMAETRAKGGPNAAATPPRTAPGQKGD